MCARNVDEIGCVYFHRCSDVWKNCIKISVMWVLFEDIVRVGRLILLVHFKLQLYSTLGVVSCEVNHCVFKMCQGLLLANTTKGYIRAGGPLDQWVKPSNFSLCSILTSHEKGKQDSSLIGTFFDVRQKPGEVLEFSPSSLPHRLLSIFPLLSFAQLNRHSCF